MKKLFMLIIASMLVFGCAPRKVVMDSGPGVDPTKAKQAGEAGADGTEGTGTDETVVSEDLPVGERPAGSTYEAGREISDADLPDIYFDFDRYEIKPEYRQTLMEISDWLIRNKAVVLIEGHCDERGTGEYNLALGDRRAKATRDFLMASGVPSRKIEYISYGEERPQCTEQAESCWSINRRAHFVVGLE